MSSPFVAEIRMFGFQFAPKGWAFCAGQLLPISQNTALFSLLGTFYGGDGKSTFGLPNLEGSCALGQGQSSASGQQYFLGEQSGVQFVTLIQTEMPVHTHQIGVEVGRLGVNPTPAPDQYIGKASGGSPFFATPTNGSVMNFNVIGIAGGSQPHNNMQPYLTLNYCIALQGVFPARN